MVYHMNNENDAMILVAKGYKEKYFRFIFLVTKGNLFLIENPWDKRDK